MQQRYFIHLGFDGTRYSGWQRQKDTHNTVQETIESSLFKIFKKEISVYGCGRTDAGVHASQYVIQIHLDQKPPANFKFILNKNLPDDIAVFEIFEVTQDQHCRYDATWRTYDYFIHWKKDPGLMQYSALYDTLKLDFDVIKQAAQLLLKTQDFRAVCKQPDLFENTLCTIKNSQIMVNHDLGRMRFTITANRFLRGMIRNIVFFLLEIGTGKMTLTEFEAILNQEKEWSQHVPAHPNGLFLSKIEYPFVELQESHQIIKMLKTGLD